MNMMDEIRKYTKEDFVILYELEDYYQNLGNLQDIAEVIFDDEDDMPEASFHQDSDKSRNYLNPISHINHIMAFTEITRCGDKLFSDMDTEEKEKAVPLIIDSFAELSFPPVAYSVKHNSIVFAWYLDNTASLWWATKMF